MPLIALIVMLLIVCLLFWAITSIMSAFGVGDPIATIVKVIFVVLVVLWLLSAVGLGVPLVRLR